MLDLLDQYPISFGRSEDGEQLVFVADVDITHPIRDNQVTNNVSWVAALAPVREKLVALQQEIAAEGGIVMDGRDIGTVVLPHAELKIFWLLLWRRGQNVAIRKMLRRALQRILNC